MPGVVGGRSDDHDVVITGSSVSPRSRQAPFSLAAATGDNNRSPPSNTAALDASKTPTSTVNRGRLLETTAGNDVIPEWPSPVWGCHDDEDEVVTSRDCGSHGDGIVVDPEEKEGSESCAGGDGVSTQYVDDLMTT